MRTATHWAAALLAGGLLAAPALRAQDRHADPHHHHPEREYLGEVRQATRSLVHALEELHHHGRELREQRHLHEHADAALYRAMHFRDTLKAGADRRHLYRDFEEMDREVHALLDAGRRLGRDHRAIHEDLARIHRADQLLHFALSRGDPSPERRHQVIRRQTELLLAEAREFDRVARGHRAHEEVHEFVEAADHFHRSSREARDVAHVRRDFARLNEAWARVTSELSDLNPREHAYLLSRAQRLDAIHGNLFEQMGIEGERPRLILRYERRDR